MQPQLKSEIDAVRVIDTHEHLVEESERLADPTGEGSIPCKDWSLLLVDYCEGDLRSAGLSADDIKRYRSPETDPLEKWRVVEPFYRRTRNTGYLRAVEISVRELFGITELNERTIPELNERFLAGIRPGYYYDLLRDRCGIDTAQVNALERPFRETAQPDLLHQDLGVLGLTVPEEIEKRSAETGISVRGLDDWLAVIDRHFDHFASKAVAIKSQMAYLRRLDFGEGDPVDADCLISRLARGRDVPLEERKPLQDLLTHHCIRRAVEHDLPVKLHTGYLAGHGYMPAGNVLRHAEDLFPLINAYPEARFVLMHMGYPTQDTFIALAKHFPQVYIDLCWAWIINPAATEQFVYEFLQTAPASKLLGFGGDYVAVENVYGHLSIARRGLYRALSRLVEEGWFGREQAAEAARRILRENAVEVFRLE